MKKLNLTNIFVPEFFILKSMSQKKYSIKLKNCIILNVEVSLNDKIQSEINLLSLGSV